MEEWSDELGKKYNALGSFRAIYTAVSPTAEEPLQGFILEDRDSGACLVRMHSDSHRLAICHGASSTVSNACRSMAPHVGVGGFTPTPRKLKEASAIIAAPRLNVAATMMGAKELGSICPIIMRELEAPMDRAANT